MIGLLGVAIVFVMVFGGFLFAGGKLEVILHAVPHEMIVIGGAAVGAFVIANGLGGVGHTLRAMKRVFTGPRWKPDDYRDLLCLLFELVRLSRQNPLALEEHIEAPQESSIFARYPRIRTDGEAVDLIADTMRSASMNYNDPNQVEEVMEKRMAASYQHALHPSHALQVMADGLPALGIVAAVLGVIKTMGSIDQPPEVLGAMIGGALVGTFLGVFLAYGFVGPFASRLKAVIDEDRHFYQLIREVLVASLYSHATNLCIEVGRQNTPSHIRPSYSALEEALKVAKEAA